RAAKYYYMPSWAEPGPTVGLYVNQGIYQGLPKSIQEAIRITAHQANQHMLDEYQARNGPALERLISKGVQIRTFPADVFAIFDRYTIELHVEIAQKNQLYGKVDNQWSAFRDSVRQWNKVSDYTYQRYVFGDQSKQS